jgi:Co/Zn/Cd efflux system component
MSHRRRPLAAALTLNSIALIAEVGAGIPSHSLSLVMDGVHNLSDGASEEELR